MTSRRPPRGVAISGVVCAILLSATIVLIRKAVPADPGEPGEWLHDPTGRSAVRLALQCVPFAGLAFLWFLASVRSRIGRHEDQFFSAVQLASGLLFTAMLFATSSVVEGALTASTIDDRASAAAYQANRATAFALMNGYGLRMAAVFMAVTSTIGLRTGVFSKPLAIAGFVGAAALLVAVAVSAWLALVFPLWVAIMSVAMLYADFPIGAAHGPPEPRRSVD